MHIITLNAQETQLVIDALSTINPTGGGSAINTLLHKIMGQTHVEGNIKNIMNHTNTVLEEAVEVGVVEYVQGDA